jgi:hypothetical protein
MGSGLQAQLSAAFVVAVTAAGACSSDPDVVFRDRGAEPGCGDLPACPAGYSCSNGVCLEPSTGGVGGRLDASGVGGVGGTGFSTGGAAGRGGSGGPGGGGPGGGRVRCGERECSLGDSQVCCAMERSPLPSTFECRASGAGCSIGYECDGDEDCGGGECCATRGSAGEWVSFACESSCSGGALHVGCRSAANCPSGNVCCGTRTGGIFDSYTDVECSETCDGSDQTVLCGSASECRQGSCTQSSILPQGFSYCD